MKVKGFIRGDTRPVVVSLVDGANNPINITGGKVFLTINASNAPTDDSQAIVSKTVTPSLTSLTINGVLTSIDPALGLALIQLTNADTQNVTPGIYYYDVQAIDASGNVTSRQQDTWEILADITRRIV